MRNTKEIETEEKIIESDEISEYQKMGWRWKGELSDGRFIMELKIKPVPPEEEEKEDLRKYFKND